MNETAFYKIRSPSGETFLISLSEPERDTREEAALSEKRLPNVCEFARILFGKAKRAKIAR